MPYGFGAADVLTPAVHALPDCYSQELSNCLDHGNAAGLPKAQCDVIQAAYHADDKTASAMDDAVNALPICSGPSMIPYVGAAFAVGVLVTILITRH
jgi:hypothetical protein